MFHPKIYFDTVDDDERSIPSSTLIVEQIEVIQNDSVMNKKYVTCHPPVDGSR